MSKDSNQPSENQALLAFLREQSKTLYGIHFSQSGLNLLCRRYQVTRFEIEALIEQIQQEGKVGK